MVQLDAFACPDIEGGIERISDAVIATGVIRHGGPWPAYVPTTSPEQPVPAEAGRSKASLRALHPTNA